MVIQVNPATPTPVSSTQERREIQQEQDPVKTAVLQEQEQSTTVSAKPVEEATEVETVENSNNQPPSADEILGSNINIRI